MNSSDNNWYKGKPNYYWIKGYESKSALKKIISIAFPRLEQQEKIYLTIKSKNEL